MKSFKEKNFDLTKTTLKSVQIDGKLPHFDPLVTKKLKLTSFKREEVAALINKDDISIKEGYFFSHKINPENYKMVNHLLWDLYIKDDKELKIILIKNSQEKYNRNIVSKLEKFAKSDEKQQIYYIDNSQKNLEFLNERFDVKFDNYPQLILLKGNKNWVFPVELLLSYKLDSTNIANEISMFKANNL